MMRLSFNKKCEQAYEERKGLQSYFSYVSFLSVRLTVMQKQNDEHKTQFRIDLRSRNKTEVLKFGFSRGLLIF